MTIVGRSKIDHPSLGTVGGSTLHAQIENIYTNIGNHLAGRYFAFSSVANGVVTTMEHNFGAQFSDYKILLYTGSHPNLVRVADPSAAGWTIAAAVGFEKTKITVQAPGTGGPHTFAVFMTQGRGAEKLSDLDDIDFLPAPLSNQLLTYNSSTSKWEPLHLTLGAEPASISSNTITPTLGSSLQRITGAAADLQMIASPVSGKYYILANETGSNITIKNDTGATAANRIYTGTNADVVLKSQAAIAVVYDAGLSRWLLVGGSGSGGLNTSYITAGGITAVAGTHYLTNLSAVGQIVTLPVGVNGSVIRFSDAGEKWSLYPLTITPASGEKIDNLSTSESLVCDVKGGWVELSYNSVFGGWALMSLSSSVGSTSGSGEINAVLNDSAAFDTTGWTNVSRVTSGSPLSPIVTTALSISNAATSESSTSGGYYSIASLPTSLRSTNLKVEFYISTPLTDVYRLSVYAGSTRLPLSSDSGGFTSLPANFTGKFSASFDATTASAYTINITRTSGTTGPCLVTQVVVGPGEIVQGAAISEWVDFTPILKGSTSDPSLGTTGQAQFGRHMRIGSSAKIRYSVRWGSVSPTFGSGIYYFLPPTGLTFDISKIESSINNNANAVIGHGTISDDSANVTYLVEVAWDRNNDRLVMLAGSTNAPVTPTVPMTFAAQDVISIEVFVPIAEWAGNGTVNLGAGAQIEYAASTTGTWDAAATAGNTVYGPAGAPITGALSTQRNKTVRFQYPIQADDVLTLELNNGNGWASIQDIGFAYVRQSVLEFGASVSVTNSTDVTVSFYQYMVSSNTAYAAAAGATNWSAGYSWRVRKAKASSPVGFGIAGTDGSSGLYKAGQAPGLVTGAAISAGYIGFSPTAGTRTRSQQTGLTNATTTTIASITLNKGIYDIVASGVFEGASATSTQLNAGISSSLGSGAALPSSDTIGVANNLGEKREVAKTNLGNDIHSIIITVNSVVVSADNTVFRILVNLSFISGTVGGYGSIAATVRA